MFHGHRVCECVCACVLLVPLQGEVWRTLAKAPSMQGRSFLHVQTRDSEAAARGAPTMARSLTQSVLLEPRTPSRRRSGGSSRSSAGTNPGAAGSAPRTPMKGMRGAAGMRTPPSVQKSLRSAMSRSDTGILTIGEVRPFTDLCVGYCGLNMGRASSETCGCAVGCRMASCRATHHPLCMCICICIAPSYSDLLPIHEHTGSDSDDASEFTRAHAESAPSLHLSPASIRSKPGTSQPWTPSSRPTPVSAQGTPLWSGHHVTADADDTSSTSSEETVRVLVGPGSSAHIPTSADLLAQAFGSARGEGWSPAQAAEVQSGMARRGDQPREDVQSLHGDDEAKQAAADHAATVLHVVRLSGGWSDTIQALHLSTSQLLTLQDLFRSLQVCIDGGRGGEWGCDMPHCVMQLFTLCVCLPPVSPSRTG